ncbi:MAG: hypothetical protein V4506_08960 [Bacteroidota bacterium]
MKAQSISKSLIRKYINTVVNLIIIDFDMPEDDPGIYGQYIFDDLLVWIKRDDTEAVLKLAIGQLISSHFDADDFHKNEYPWDEDELRVVFKEIHRRLWPGEPIPTTEEEINWIE